MPLSQESKLVQDCKEKGYGLLATGEMGISNTTTSSAVTAALYSAKQRKSPAEARD